MRKLAPVAFLSWGGRTLEIESHDIKKLAHLLHEEAKEKSLNKETLSRLAQIQALDEMATDMQDWIPVVHELWETPTVVSFEVIANSTMTNTAGECYWSVKENFGERLGIDEATSSVSCVRAEEMIVVLKDGTRLPASINQATNGVATPDSARKSLLDFSTTIGGEKISIEGAFDHQRLSMVLHVSGNVEKVTFNATVLHQVPTVRLGHTTFSSVEVSRILETEGALASMIRLANYLRAIDNGQDVPKVEDWIVTLPTGAGLKDS